MLRKSIAAAVGLTLALAPASLAASPRKGATYMGKTSQGETVAFDVSSNGKKVQNFETALTYRCSGEHDGQSGSFVLEEMRVKGGEFTAKQTLRGTSDESVVQDGTGKVHGTFKKKGRTATGTLRSTLTLTGGETCDSGKVSFKLAIL